MRQVGYPGTFRHSPGSTEARGYVFRVAAFEFDEGAPMYQNRTSQMNDCIDDCLVCHRECLDTAMQRCLDLGGRHVEPHHFRLMLSCAEMCQTAAHMMMIGTQHHKQVCRACADICLECADDCAGLGDMDNCVEACRHCAESCRSMAA